VLPLLLQQQLPGAVYTAVSLHALLLGAAITFTSELIFFLLVTRGAKSTGWPYTAIRRT
jgi:hypothetical protein